MKKKPIPILHPILRPTGNTMALIPIGRYCNRELQNAVSGDIIEFWKEWRHEKRVLVRKCRVKIRSSIFTFLIQSIYGKHRMADMLTEWERISEQSGIGKEGFDRDECMLIEVRELTEEELL